MENLELKDLNSQVEIYTAQLDVVLMKYAKAAYRHWAFQQKPPMLRVINHAFAPDRPSFEKYPELVELHEKLESLRVRIEEIESEEKKRKQREARRLKWKAEDIRSQEEKDEAIRKIIEMFGGASDVDKKRNE